MTHRIPLGVKLAYGAFMAVLVPCYLAWYGPTNFLYYCDIALLMTFVALWWESPLWASMPAIGILIPQTVWIVDFLGELAGVHVVQMTSYMFSDSPLFVRGLSLFHLWLPLLLVWMMWRIGYDRRAVWLWMFLAWALIPICYFALPGPLEYPSDPSVPRNVNYVFGPSEKEAQKLMPPNVFFAAVMIGMPLLVFWPTHFVLSLFFRTPHQIEIQAT